MGWDKKTRGPWATPLTWGRFLHVFNIILQISYYLPLYNVEGHGSFFEKKILIYLTQECLMPSLVETGPVVLKFTISLLSLLGEGHGPAFEQT